VPTFKHHLNADHHAGEFDQTVASTVLRLSRWAVFEARSNVRAPPGIQFEVELQCLDLLDDQGRTREVVATRCQNL
jgi:hypothetical protein